MIDMDRAKRQASLLTARTKRYLPFATGDSGRAAKLGAELDDADSDACAVLLAVLCANYEVFGDHKEPVTFCQGCGKVMELEGVRCKECHDG